jgi:uncharacterized membrane protein YkvA (DUF1232 family)
VVSFYRSLQVRVEEWVSSPEAAGMSHAELYRYLPTLYIFLVRLALDGRLPEHERTGILAALKYIVAPYDLIPEGVVGTSGFRDDLVLAAMVVDRLYRVVAPDLLDEHWSAPGDPLPVARAILEARTDMIGPETSDRLTAWLPQLGL